MKRVKTKHIGVYQRESGDRLHSGRPDVCFDITYKLGTRKVWEKVGWRSEGYTAVMASQIRAERIRTARHPDATTEKAVVTMDEAWSAYLSRHLKGRPSEKIDTGRYILHIAPEFGRRALHDITALDISTLSKRWAKKQSPQTVKHALAQIRRIMRRALDWGLWSGPMPRIDMPSVDNERFRFLSVPESTALLDELERRSPPLRRLAEMSLLTGMRAGELFRLRGYHLDTSAGTINIVTSRKGHPRVAYMTDRVREIIAEINPAPRDLLFPATTGKQAVEVSDAFGRAVDALGLNDGIDDDRGRIVFHSLRHTFASWLAQDGVPLYTIGALLGHTSDKTTRRYAHLCPDGTRSAALRIQRITGNHRS